jgi:hypothetical protein
MSPALILLLLVSAFVALIPVRRLNAAGWPPRWLFGLWVMYAAGLFVGMRFAGPFRLLLPVLLLAYVAPFIAGPERLSRLLNGRGEPDRVVIDVTPRPAPGLPEPPRAADGGEHGPRGRRTRGGRDRSDGRSGPDERSGQER